MNPTLEQIPEPVLEIGGNNIAKQPISDEYNDNSTSPRLFDAPSYFDNYPFDGIVFQSLKGYEPYFSGLGYDSTSTAMSSPTTYPTSAMSLPTGAGQEFPFRTGTDPPVPPPMVSMSNSSITNQFNESFPSPNQASADIGFGPSKEADLSEGAQIQSVRNSQLEKVSDSRCTCFHKSLTVNSGGLKIGTLNVLSGNGKNPTQITWSESSCVFGKSTIQR
jgi:hypothetical protein